MACGGCRRHRGWSWMGSMVRGDVSVHATSSCRWCSSWCRRLLQLAFGSSLLLVCVSVSTYSILRYVFWCPHVLVHQLLGAGQLWAQDTQQHCRVVCIGQFWKRMCMCYLVLLFYSADCPLCCVPFYLPSSVGCLSLCPFPLCLSHLLVA